MKNGRDLRYCIAALVACAAAQSMAAVIVQDTWIDGTRTDPAATTYSEYGVDADLDGDIESAWYLGGSGTLDPVGAGGPLRTVQTTSSASVTTYFTAEGSEVALANSGDSIKVTWKFSVSGIVLANTSQGFRLALVDSPAASRVSGEASPSASTYTGYGMFMNMNSNTFTHSSPFQLLERANPSASENLLSSSSAWTAIDKDGTSGNQSYVPGTEYTYTMQITRNGADGLDILTTMAGGTLDGDGLMSVAYTDATPNGGSYAFDTFEFRGDGNDRSWETIDTSLFKVEVIPEPATIGLVGIFGVGLLFMRRRFRI